MSEQQPAAKQQPQGESKEAAGEKKPQKRGGKAFGKGKMAESIAYLERLQKLF